MNCSLTMVAALALAACHGGSSAPSGIDLDAACIPDAGVYTCLDGTWPVCPSSAKPSTPCDHSLQDCMGCVTSEGYTCTCQDSGIVFGEGGVEETVEASTWFCVSTEATCQ